MKHAAMILPGKQSFPGWKIELTAEKKADQRKIEKR